MDGTGGVMTMPMHSGPGAMHSGPGAMHAGGGGAMHAGSGMPGQPFQRMMRPQMYARPNARNFQPRPGSEMAKQLEANPEATIAGQNVLFDGKRMRKAMHRKTVDYNSAVIQYMEVRTLQIV